MLSLEPIVDAEGVSTWQAVNAAAFSADYVGLTADPAEERLPALRGPVSGERAEFWLGSADGVPVAAGELTLPLYDNLGAAYGEIQIHPEHRRKGYGRALLGKLRQRTRKKTARCSICRPRRPVRRSPGQPGPNRCLPRSAGCST